jgi:hypothetical protein
LFSSSKTSFDQQCGAENWKFGENDRLSSEKTKMIGLVVARAANAIAALQRKSDLSAIVPNRKQDMSTAMLLRVGRTAEVVMPGCDHSRTIDL